MEEIILNLFTESDSLSFNEIEKKTKTRSNKLAYHLKKLLIENKLTKKDRKYKISEESEYLIPYISTKKAVLPVILIEIRTGNSIFLIKRNKRPYKNLLGLPGGRILLGESIEETAKRIMKKTANIEINKIKIKDIIFEKITKSEKTIHSFILIIVKAQTKSKLNLTKIKENKSKIIKSDYKIINSRDKEIELKTINSKLN